MSDQLEIPKAPLARTLEHHLAVGSTPGELLGSNPGKTQAELMSDSEILERMLEEERRVREAYVKAWSGDEVERRIFNLCYHSFYAPNIAYLREIRRLPEEFKFVEDYLW